MAGLKSSESIANCAWTNQDHLIVIRILEYASEVFFVLELGRLDYSLRARIHISMEGSEFVRNTRYSTTMRNDIMDTVQVRCRVVW